MSVFHLVSDYNQLVIYDDNQDGGFSLNTKTVWEVWNERNIGPH